MKIQILSDTHQDLSRFKINPEIDLIVHAGDFSKGVGNSVQHIVNFTDMCDEANKDYVLVLGNHDYYGFVYREELLQYLDELNINYLVIGKEYKKDSWTFIGDTLFTEFNLSGYDNEFLINNAEFYLNDFKYIKYNYSSLIRPQDYILEFSKQWSWIESYRNKPNVFVITHFLPSKELEHPQYKGDYLNPYYMSNLNLTGFSKWVVGHSHQTLHKIIDGCDIYMNAYGYTNGIEWECPEFNPNYIIEI